MSSTFEVADLSIEFVWCDSLGAKSVCCRVQTPDTSVVIDPGVAVMQPSFPLPSRLKEHLKSQAEGEIRRAVAASDLVAVTHYHHDHYLRDAGFLASSDTELWIKDPNRWINDAQWDRAREFLSALADEHEEGLEEIEPRRTRFPDPLDELEHAREKDFGDYQDRREELLARWRERFEGRVERWSTMPWVREPGFLGYADGRTVERGETTVRFLGPWFHGIEYSATGFVVPVLVQTPEASFLHSSDLHGPVVEDYADRIIELAPDALFLDGPATYLLGPMLNWTNLQRSIDNAERILRGVDPEVMVFDHHLLRERQYRERTREVWRLAEDGYNVTTVAELAGKQPMIDRVQSWSDEDIQKRLDALEG